MADWIRKHGLGLGVFTLGCLAAVFAALIVPQVRYLWGLEAVAEPSVGNPYVTDYRCGPKSLMIALGRLGVPVEWARIEEIPVEPGKGTTLGELKQAALDLGVGASARSLSWEELTGLGSAAICHVKGDHFVAVDPRESAGPEPRGAKLRVYDPDRVASWWTRGDFEKIWRGQCLVLEKKAAAAQGPRLEWDACYLDCGMLREVVAQDFEARLRNGGSEPLEVAITGTSCSCAEASLSATVLQPGESATLHAKINLQGRRGAFFQNVALRSNDPGLPQCRVFCSGAVLNTELLSTRKLHWGAVRPGQRSRREIFLTDPGDGRLEVAEATWTPTEESGYAMKASARRLTADWLARRETKDGHLQPGDFVIELELTVAEDCAPRRIAGEVALRTNLPRPFDQFRVAVEGAVVNDLEASPAAVLLSDAALGGGAARVTIQSVLKRPVGVEKVLVKGELPVELEAPRQLSESSVELVVRRVAGRPAAADGEGSLVCHVRGGRTIEVPLVVLPAAAAP